MAGLAFASQYFLLAIAHRPITEKASNSFFVEFLRILSPAYIYVSFLGTVICGLLFTV